MCLRNIQWASGENNCNVGELGIGVTITYLSVYLGNDPVQLEDHLEPGLVPPEDEVAVEGVGEGQPGEQRLDYCGVLVVQPGWAPARGALEHRQLAHTKLRQGRHRLQSSYACARVL